MPSQPLRQLFILSLCGIFLFVQWGCATQHTSHRIPTELGKVGLVAAQYTPAVEFELPAKGWLSGAGRGAVQGTKSFILLVPTGAFLGTATLIGGGAGGGAALTLAFMAIGALLKGAGYLIIGPFYGAATAEVPATVEEAEAQLKAALASMRIQETFSKYVWQAAPSKLDLPVLEGQGPESPSDLLTYLPLQDAKIDTVMELRVTRLWLSSNESFFQPLIRTFSEDGQSLIDPKQELEINPSLSLGMEARVRLIRTADQVVLYDKTGVYTGGYFLFAEWAADNAHLFGLEIERAYQDLANRVVNKILRGPS
jgi:hypothetical protein